MPTSQYYRTAHGVRSESGHCICHDYIFDHAIKRWSIIEGNRKIQKRGKKQRTVSANGAQGAPRFNEYRLLDDRVIYCINCRVKMIYHKEFAHSTGWIASFRCPNCTREQHYH